MQTMLEIKTFEFGPFATNTYIVSDEAGNALLIDPACSNQYEQQTLYRYVQENHLNIQAIIATHGHLDHLWGAKWACEQWHMPVMMHEADIPMAQAMQQQYNLFGIRATAESFPIEPLPESIPFFQVLHTPGHTPGSICLYRPEEGLLLSGDTLFRMGYGRTDLPGGHMGQLMESLETLFTLPSGVRVYPGHGEFTTIGAENNRW